MADDNYKLLYPNRFLKNYIKYYWIIKIDKAYNNTQRVYPTGEPQIIFYELQKLYGSVKGYICGQSTKFNDIVFNPPINIIGIVFKPYGLKVFLDIPAIMKAGYYYAL